LNHEEFVTNLKNHENINNVEKNVFDLNINSYNINNNNRLKFHKHEEVNEKKIKKILNKENVLISLPLYVSRFFLNNWIQIDNICFLDSSFCNKQQRTVFLYILNGFVTAGRDFDSAKDTYYQNLNYDTKLYIKWILKRNILVKNLYISRWNKSVIHYFQNIENNKNLFLKSLTFNFDDYRFFKNFNEKTLLELLNSKNFKNVSKISLINDHVTIISDLILIAIANNFKNLKVLEISFSANKLKNRVTDSGLFSIATHCNLLENINLSGNSAITDLSLIEIANNCKNLKKINLDYCHQITNKGIVAIAKNCVKFEEISLSQNKNVTDFTLFEVSKNCSNLKILNLSDCFQISDNGIIAIANNALNIEKLNLNYCSKITKKSLIYITKKSLTLKELDCYNDNQSASFCNLKVIIETLNHIPYYNLVLLEPTFT
jgi:hypothetical protein